MSGFKPYTISNLSLSLDTPNRSDFFMTPDETVYLRITTINEETGLFWRQRIFPDLPDEIRFLNTKFCIVSAFMEPREHPWAHWQTFGDLVQQAEKQPSGPIKMVFASPTTFRVRDKKRNKEYQIVTPDPARIIRSWWRKWNLFAPKRYQMENEWIDRVCAQVYVTRLWKIRTIRWRYPDDTRSIIGFLGEMDFSLMHPHRYFGVDSWVRLRTLAKFSFYAGTGRKATYGAGQTRPRINPTKADHVRKA
jgi:CRISPR-associated endoribonuclease Cas6